MLRRTARFRSFDLLPAPTAKPATVPARAGPLDRIVSQLLHVVLSTRRRHKSKVCNSSFSIVLHIGLPDDECGLGSHPYVAVAPLDPLWGNDPGAIHSFVGYLAFELVVGKTTELAHGAVWPIYCRPLYRAHQLSVGAHPPTVACRLLRLCRLRLCHLLCFCGCLLLYLLVGFCL